MKTFGREGFILINYFKLKFKVNKNLIIKTQIYGYKL